MNIIEKIYEMREDELVNISPKEKEDVLKISPNYYTSSKLETLAENNVELKKAYDDFFVSTHLVNSYFNKKYYLAGLKDGINILRFAKGDELNDC